MGRRERHGGVGLMAPTFAELALDSAPKRLTTDHVAALVEADAAAKRIEAERLVREHKRQQRLERERQQRVAEAKGERAARGIAAVRRATKGQG